MCAPRKIDQNLPNIETIKAPPPPEKTADELYLSKDIEEKNSNTKKKRGTQKLKTNDISSLVIPSGTPQKGTQSGLIIP